MTLVASPDQVSCELSGEVAILHLPSGTYFGLNEVGALVWNLVQEPVAEKVLVDAITTEFDVDEDLCSRDLAALVAQLSERGLVEVAA